MHTEVSMGDMTMSEVFLKCLSKRASGGRRQEEDKAEDREDGEDKVDENEDKEERGEKCEKMG